MIVLVQQLHEGVKKVSINVFLKNFAVFVQQRYATVVLQQSFNDFLEDWRDGGFFPVFW